MQWGYGEIGKHAGLKNQCRKASRFDSGYPYQTLHLKVDKDRRRLFVQLVTFDIIAFLQRCTKSVRKSIKLV